MITPEQIRAARAIVRMEQADLAARAGVSLGTIKRLEGLDGTTNAQESTLAGIKAALEGVGVMFLDDKQGTPRGGPGVRLAEAEPEVESAQVKSALSMMAKTIEAAADKLGIGKNEIGQIVKDAEAETYLKISRETMRKALGPGSLPNNSKSVQLLRKYMTGELTPPPDDDESE